MEVKILAKVQALQSIEITLTQGEIIPIHDHPKTTVFLYCVSGRLAITSYTLLGAPLPEGTPLGTRVQIKQEASTVLTKGTSTLLTPDYRNLHRIEALTSAVFMDVMTPAYFESGDCLNFYELIEGQADAMLVQTVPEPKSAKAAKARALRAYHGEQ